MIYREYSKSKNVVYIIDTNKREVSAKISCSIEDAQTMFFSLLKRFIKGNGGVSPVVQNPFASFDLNQCSYTGRAKCHPDDTFNVEFGKRLALSRAKQKYLHAVNKQLINMYRLLFNFEQQATDLCLKSYRREIENNKDIYSLEEEAGFH